MIKLQVESNKLQADLQKHLWEKVKPQEDGMIKLQWLAKLQVILEPLPHPVI